jgi:hypothetical protein
VIEIGWLSEVGEVDTLSWGFWWPSAAGFALFEMLEVNRPVTKGADAEPAAVFRHGGHWARQDMPFVVVHFEVGFAAGATKVRLRVRFPVFPALVTLEILS